MSSSCGRRRDTTRKVRPGYARSSCGSFEKHGAVNITGARGPNYKGNILETSLESIEEQFKDGNSPYCVFDTKEKLESFLTELKERDYGLSVSRLRTV